MRPFLRLSRGGDSSVYLVPQVPNPAYMANWDLPLRAEQRVAPGLHMSIHRSGVVNAKYKRDGRDAELDRYVIPRLERMESPTYILQLLIPKLEYYPVIEQPRRRDVVLDASSVDGKSFSVSVAVGPDLSSAVPAGRARIPYPGIGNNAIVGGIASAQVGPFYFAAALVAPRDMDAAPPPVEIETWVPIKFANPEDYLPRRGPQ